MTALGRLRGRRARALLLGLARRTGPTEIRCAAVAALARSAGLDALPVLLDLVGNRSESNRARSVAVEGLARLLYATDRRTRPYREAVTALLPLLNEEDGEVRFWAIYALGALRARSTVQMLEELARVDDHVSSLGWANREEARDALHSIRTGEWPTTDACERARAQS